MEVIQSVMGFLMLTIQLTPIIGLLLSFGFLFTEKPNGGKVPALFLIFGHLAFGIGWYVLYEAFADPYGSVPGMALIGYLIAHAIYVAFSCRVANKLKALVAGAIGAFPLGVLATGYILMALETDPYGVGDDWVIAFLGAYLPIPWILICGWLAKNNRPISDGEDDYLFELERSKF